MTSDRHDSAGSPELAWVDGDVVGAAEATVPLTDDGFLRGDAVFEGVLVRRGRTHALDRHLARMRRSAAAIDLDLPPLDTVAHDLLDAWGERDGAMKLVVTRGGAVRGLMMHPAERPPTLSLAIVDIPWRTPLSGVKTLSYVVNQWAKREAARRDTDDALIVDDGVVCELATGTLVVVRDGEAFSPDPRAVPILESVTLAELREAFDVSPATLTLDDVTSADELFVLSATRPVIGVHRLLVDDADDCTFEAPGAVTRLARERLDQRIDDSLDLR